MHALSCAAATLRPTQHGPARPALHAPPRTLRCTKRCLRRPNEQRSRRTGLSSAAAASGAAAGGEQQPADAETEPFFFSCEMSVRDYELDQYSVVNNAVYANFLQHVRHEFLCSLGINADAVARQGDALALSELRMRYVRPLRSGDRFRGTCRVVKATAARLVFEQQLWLLPPRQRHGAASGSGHGSVAASGSTSGSRGGEDGSEQLVLSAEAVVVSLDSQYKPKRIDPRLRQLLVTGRPPMGEAGEEPVLVQELL